MGAYFKLGHANIMAFVTSRSRGAPEFAVTTSPISRHVRPRHEAYAVPEPAFEPSPEEISRSCSRATSRLREHGTRSSRDATGLIVERVLEELRSELSDYALFALLSVPVNLSRAAKQLPARPCSANCLC